MSRKLTIDAISDTHGLVDITSLNYSDADVFIHAGDLTKRGRKEQLKRVLREISKLPHEHKLIIAGNHDHCMAWSDLTDLYAEYGVVCLHNASTEINGVKFFGTPYTPRYGTWDFMLWERDLCEMTNTFPTDVDVFISHGPPYRILDTTYYCKHAGSTSTRLFLDKVKPKVMICGHIHESHGSQVYEETTVYNVSIVDHQYINRWNTTNISVELADKER